MADSSKLVPFISVGRRTNIQTTNMIGVAQLNTASTLLPGESWYDKNGDGVPE